MKAARILSTWMAAIGLLASGGACADPQFVRGRIGWDITIGLPFPWYYGPSYYGPSYHYPYYPYYPYYPPRYDYYYDYPPRIVVPSAPREYVEREAPPQPGAIVPGYWYYCRSREGYYPYIKECPSGWERVSPVPPTPPAQK